MNKNYIYFIIQAKTSDENEQPTISTLYKRKKQESTDYDRDKEKILPDQKQLQECKIPSPVPTSGQKRTVEGNVKKDQEPQIEVSEEILDNKLGNGSEVFNVEEVEREESKEIEEDFDVEVGNEDLEESFEEDFEALENNDEDDEDNPEEMIDQGPNAKPAQPFTVFIYFIHY